MDHDNKSRPTNLQHFIPNFFSQLESYYLCYLGDHTKIWNPMISLSGIYFKIAHFPVKIGLIHGVVGVPEFFFSIGILLFMLLGGPHTNFEPYDKPFWNIFENSPFSGQNRVNWGGKGGPRNSFFIGILIFLLLRSPRKVS